MRGCACMGVRVCVRACVRAWVGARAWVYVPHNNVKSLGAFLTSAMWLHRTSGAGPRCHQRLGDTKAGVEQGGGGNST